MESAFSLESRDAPGAHPRVAAIVPAYGVAHLVGEALASLQAQTMPHWECVVIDDGSPDDVAAAVGPFLSDPRIRFLSTTNHGVSSARNTAIRACGAQLVTLLDGDDLLRPDYFATIVPLMEADPQIRITSCNARIFGAVPAERIAFGPGLGSGDGVRGSLADVIDRSFGVYIGSTFRRADFDAIGGFDETMAYSEDFDFWLRLMLLGGHAHYVNTVLGDYRVRVGSASANIQRLHLGNLKTFAKASAALPADHELQPLLARMIAQSQAALDIENAIDRVIDGDTQGGLVALRAAGADGLGRVWSAALTSWRVFPSLARPMLRWRRMAHGREVHRSTLSRLIEAFGR